MSLLEILKQQSLLNQALEEVDQMFKISKKMFSLVTENLLTNKKIDIDIEKEDKKLNLSEVNIRKKVFEHLSINPQKDLSSSLIVIDIARDVERTGDFSKNIYKYTDKLSPLTPQTSYWKELKKMSKYIEQLIEDVRVSFKNSDPKLIEKAIAEYRKKIYSRADNFILKLSKEKELAPREIILLTLSVRFLKRTTAHLINIATSLVNDFSKIRYTKDIKDV